MKFDRAECLRIKAYRPFGIRHDKIGGEGVKTVGDTCALYSHRNVLLNHVD
jgi:hypothetical protein